jgi:AcrR family transcriptional regulator
MWGERGYAAASTPEIAEAAGVTRGAMYHQYANKTELFVAVLEAIETEVIQRLTADVIAAEPSTPAETLHVTADAWLQIAVEPEIRQLMLLDAPSILGWAGFREVSQRYGLGMTEQLLSAAIDAGELRAQPTRPLATIVLAALDEAAMIIANATDPVRETQEVRTVVHDLIDGLLEAAGTGRPPPEPGERGQPNGPL